jgi:hypothetical protein
MSETQIYKPQRIFLQANESVAAGLPRTQPYIAQDDAEIANSPPIRLLPGKCAGKKFLGRGDFCNVLLVKFAIRQKIT